jgi:SAM-dependent methyltransferase
MDRANVEFHLASVDAMPLEDNSQDFGYSLGVLHHVPDTCGAIRACVRKLKPKAPILLYLYYRVDNRPGWFERLWKASDYIRQSVSRAPFRVRKLTTDVVAALIYWPLARSAKMLEKLGMDITNIPLSAYRSRSFYTMRTDALDRFGTRLEQRFSRAEIEIMMKSAGLVDIHFSETEPFWVVYGRRAD